MAPDLLPMYDEMALNSFLQGHNGTMRWCPGPNCGHVVVHSRRGLFLHEQGEIDRFAKCDHCQTRFCYDCGEAPHEGRACLRIYDETEAAVEADGGTEDGEGDADEETPVGPRTQGRPAVAGRPGRQGRAAQTPAESEENKIDKKIRLCPSCQVPIEKNGGCNHMREFASKQACMKRPQPINLHIFILFFMFLSTRTILLKVANVSFVCRCAKAKFDFICSLYVGVFWVLVLL